MNKSISSIALLLGATFLSTIGQAKTFKYELDNFYISPAQVNYPNLDLSGPGSAELIVEQDSENSPAELISLKIHFANAPSVTVRDFKGENGNYRAEVNNVWVYRKLLVEVSVNGPNFDAYGNSNVSIQAYVSEKDLFIGNSNDPYFYADPSSALFYANGVSRDTSSLIVIDNTTVNLDGKSVKLNLKNGFRSTDNNFAPHFVIDSVWMGQGQNTLYIPAGFSANFVNFAEPVRLVVDQNQGPNGLEHMISVVVKDSYGGEVQSPSFPLKDVLYQAYNLPL